MITLVLGELYGMDSQKELMQTIEELRRMGMSDSDIQAILDRSKTETPLQAKIDNAKPSTWLTDGLTEEEVREEVEKGKKRVCDRETN